jgi:methylenetetrahydrofolate dehydrogenase (NADP+)/methenyltetrahydrofolate cyclohydrolase
MTATLIDGKRLAATLRERITVEVATLAARRRRVPGLAVVLVGDDPASHAYVRTKTREIAATGMRSLERRLPADTSEAALAATIDALNADDGTDGILVQLPVPPQIDAARVLGRVDPAKDVDGFHPLNAGRLASGLPGLVPCTPRGCIHLLRSLGEPLAGRHAVVVGRSNIVGKPLAQLLLREDCTVTVAHSRTRDLPALCRTADILVAAIGRPQALGAAHVREGAVVIDVGINRVAGADGRARLVGDVDFAAAAPRAAAITPVPGGVGPMTVACLLENTLDAYRARTA